MICPCSNNCSSKLLAFKFKSFSQSLHHFLSHKRSGQFSKQNTISPLWIDWGAVASKRERSSGVRIMWFFFASYVARSYRLSIHPLPWKNRVINFPSLTQGGPKNHVVLKGQIILKAILIVLIWTKNPTKLFFDICPGL